MECAAPAALWIETAPALHPERCCRAALHIGCGRRHDYTEKIVDAWLSWTLPIYWGCPNLAELYPRESFIEIDLTAPDAADEVVRRSREPVSRLTLAAIAEARHLALNRYGVWGTMERLLDPARVQ